VIPSRSNPFRATPFSSSFRSDLLRANPLRKDSANPALVRDYGDDLHIFPSRQTRVAVGLLLVVAVLAPLRMSNFQATVLDYAGIAAIGAIGLNLLTGFTGQVSLGHAFFLGTGSYTAAYLGGHRHWPFLLFLIAAAFVGGLVGAVVGPFALRLRGNYLAIITVGLVFIGQHVFENWTSVTGGLNGTSVPTPPRVGPVDFSKLKVFGHVFGRNQGFFYIVWILVALVALTSKNLVRSRPGRAMQAVRDRDVAAEAIGIRLSKYKVLAFVVSSSLAAMAGALFGSYQQFVAPGDFNLFVSLQYIAMIVVGGVGTTFGPILGALFITAVPRLIEQFSDHIPGVTNEPGAKGITVFSLNQAIFGILIIAFLVLEPRGLAALWLRVKAYFRSWPLSY
jgi:branched-chain amino acid transport system permease protein